ncbi:LPD7 domain-containing protein [Chromobacterium violaceum]|uniref:LPD7 domain-containing protein n=1 Tax=Chromobacterium violaceum TaxID=536 RepID=UPI0035A57572
MAVIRIKGGKSGIREYLENGQKEGRDFTRDQLDSRIVLYGDLEVTDQIIQMLDSDHESYMHITMAFKEDYVSDDVLKSAVEDFRQFAFSAHGIDEYNFYAEAHIPKIKSYVNKKTGEFVERKPHIHFVIPNVNLLTVSEKKPQGNKLGLFGVVKHQIKFIDAFQESTNNKYGLASPKDNRRVYFSDDSDMISRYKGDFFNGQNSELREAILSEIIAREIKTYDAFKELVSEFGVVRVRNEGKPREYLNIKPAGKDKGVNLNGEKNFVFSREFIELSQSEKLKYLEREVVRKYEEVGKSQRDPDYIAETLKEWHEIRAKEIKYINSGNRKLYQSYKAAERDEKVAMLSQRAARFYEKHRGLDNGTSTSRSNTKSIGQEPPPAARNRLRLLSELDVARDANRGEVLLQGDVRDFVEHERAESDRTVRRPDDRVERPADNVIGQHQADAESEKIHQEKEKLSEFQEIKRYLDARRLLAYLSKTHGVIPEKYEVSKGKDGSDRIQCGSRHLNVSDFLVKELELSWAEAIPILRECYAAQLGREPAQEPRRELSQSEQWAAFQKWKAERVQNKDKAWELQKASQRDRKGEILKWFNEEKARIYAATENKYVERRAAFSLARMEKIGRDKALAEQIKAERQALKEKYAAKASELFRVFLQERAQAGDVQALAELRRQRIEPLQRDDQGKQLGTGATDEQHRRGEDLFILGENITHRVAINGEVTYQLDGRDVLRDEVRAVKVLDENNDRAVLETGLRLALQKFGPRIHVRGDEEFQRRIVEVSVDAGLRVTFTDPLLNEYRQQLEAEKRTEIEQAKELAKAAGASPHHTQPKSQASAAPADVPKPPKSRKEQGDMDQPTVSRGKSPTAEERKAEEKRHYEEALRRAKDADLPTWLLNHGVKIQKNGTAAWKFAREEGEADRIFKSSAGNWMVHTHHGGDRSYMDAIAYAQLQTGLSHRQAVESLSGVQLSAVATGQPAAVAAAAKKAEEKGVRPDPVVTAINIHEATQQQRRNAYNYALDRGISQETLRDAGEQGVIKADHRGLVFVGYDQDGKIRNAETRLIKAERLGDEMTTKICYSGTDKTYPPILRGNDKEVHFVEGGFDALALRDMYKRDGLEPPTTVITGGARTQKWQHNPEICELIQSADHVRLWYDNELTADGQLDTKKQADTQEAHNKQLETIVQIRGNAEGVEEMRPREGIKDIAEWNVQEAAEHQAHMQQAEEEEETRGYGMRP